MRKRQIKPSTPSQVRCADCGLTYDAGAPHTMFCPACTCDGCGSTFSSASALHNTGIMLHEEDDDGVAIERPEKWCDQCWDDDRSEEEDEDES